MPYVRFYMSDWLAGTRGMKAAEIGVYFTLLALMYERGEPLQDQPNRLARQCGCTPKTFSSIVSMLVDEGKIVLTGDDGLWNERVQKEFDFREKNSNRNSEAAKIGWEKRSKNNGTKKHSHSGRNAVAMPNPEARSQNIESSYEDLSSGDDPALLDLPSNVDDAVRFYSDAAKSVGLPIPRQITPDRRRKIAARLKESGMPMWREAVTRLIASPFCRGSNERGWRADLDFLLQPKSFNGLVEGKYDERKGHRSPAPREATMADYMRERLNRHDDDGRTIEGSDFHREGAGAQPYLLPAAGEGGRRS